MHTTFTQNTFVLSCSISMSFGSQRETELYYVSHSAPSAALHLERKVLHWLPDWDKLHRLLLWLSHARLASPYTSSSWAKPPHVAGYAVWLFNST